MKSVYGLLLFLSSIGTFGQSTQLAKLKYNGGGDWYANKTALPNLMAFCNRELKTNFPSEEDIVEVGSPDLFRYPWIYMTGHGEVTFSDAEARNLRKYLVSGGFLHVDDNYGLDPFIRREMKKVFPELEFVELPFRHPLYNQKFSFPKGLPKVHVHDNKPPQGFALIWEGRVVCFYSYECDLGNGWEDARIHGNPEEVRLAALQMGANLIQYVFTAQ